MSALTGALLAGTTATAAGPPEHLTLAEAVADTITPSANGYGSPAKVTWFGENGLWSSTVRATCSSFLTVVLERAYAVDFEAWFGTDSPNSACYHDMIEAEHGFVRIESIADVRAGHVAAIRYDDAGCDVLSCDSHTGCASTGHTMLVAATPTPRASTPPWIIGTKQYTLKVLDVTASAHGPGDTRWHANPDSSNDTGVGTGTMRLYVDADDPDHPIIGYTWSTAASSEFHPQSERDLVIGDYQYD